jgi:hypothetical protein
MACDFTRLPLAEMDLMISLVCGERRYRRSCGIIGQFLSLKQWQTQTMRGRLILQPESIHGICIETARVLGICLHTLHSRACLRHAHLLLRECARGDEWSI